MLTEIKNKIDSFFKNEYKVEDTNIVPDTDYTKLTFGNKGLKADFAFLFVDIRDSSNLTEKYGFENSARIYQGFHEICVSLIINNQGQVRAFDGDRVMGVFSGGRKRTNAINCALEIRWAISNTLNKNLKEGIKIGCGIDAGTTLITKIGKGYNSNNNDLIWIGKACNYASHLAQKALDSINISTEVYKNMLDEVKYKYPYSKQEDLWKTKIITKKDGKMIFVYETNYWKPIR